MRLNLLFFSAGVCLLQQMAQLPQLYWALVIPAGFVACFFCRYKRFLYPLLFFACGFFHAAFFASERLADQLNAKWEGQDIDLVGVVSEMPQATRGGQSFRFAVEKILTPEARVPRKIQLANYQDFAVHAGERWQFKVKLKRPHGNSNPYGFDYEVWLLERKIGASGYVRADAARLSPFVWSLQTIIERLREKVRHRIEETTPQSGALVALAVGDQRAISERQWQLYRRTGVIHLMSISGLHVTMVAGLFSSMVYFLWRRSALAGKIPARKAAAIAAMIAALIYSLLAGFSVPTQRTFFMLSVVAVAVYNGKAASALNVLLLALFFVLLIDPWAVFAPGFWLSFGAVALIFYATQHRIGRMNWFSSWVKVQWAVTVGMIPMLLFIFQQVSLVSPIANAFAIPLVSFIVVPLTLIGAFLPLDFPLHLAAEVFSFGEFLLQQLALLPQSVWEQHAPPLWTLVPAAGAVLLLLAPKGIPGRWLGFFGLLPLFLAPIEQPAPGQLLLTVLDVGQGLAVVAQSSNHALLFDAGPAFAPGSDSGSRIIVPFLRGNGLKHLDGMILSHADTDHSGGAMSVFEYLPVSWLLSSLPDDDELRGRAKKDIPCMAGEHWLWDGVSFEILSPDPAVYGDPKARENAKSCMLKISTQAGSALIAADVEKSVEKKMLAKMAEKLHCDLLVVPHHGGLSASSPPFVTAASPAYAVFSAGYKNRFDHPRAEIVDRYRQAGSKIYRTDLDGAILADFSTGLTVQSWREKNRRYWFNSP